MLPTAQEEMIFSFEQKPSEQKSVEQQTPLQLPDHLTALPGQQWAVWNWVGLRAAGFPVAHVTELYSAECAAAADQLIQAEDLAEQKRKEALDRVNRLLDAMRRDQAWEGADGRDQLIAAMRHLKAGKVPASSGIPPAPQSAIEEMREARSLIEPARESFNQAYKVAVAQTSESLYKAASAARLLEAITWQNRRAVQTGIAVFLRQPSVTASRGSKQRQHEEMIASYLQRYCVKNDTIGFFGPLGWARVVDNGEMIAARPGPELLETRDVRFETWGIDALAESLAANKELRPWMPPRRMPYIHIEGSSLYLPVMSKLPAEVVTVLRACDGDLTARQIATQLIESGTTRFKSESDVYAVLEYLSAKGLILWTLEVPVELHPEQTLRGLLERIEDESLRAYSLGALAEFEAAREAVAGAAGDAERLDRALGDIDTKFTSLTGKASTREAGEMYAARTLVYEDCRRNIDVELGPELIAALAPSMSLLMDSARWFTHETAATYRKVFKKVYTELAWKIGSPVVDGVSFWRGIQPILYTDKERPHDKHVLEFQDRWSRVLSIPPDQRRVEYTSEQLRPLVEDAFTAPGPGWRSGLYHSPDVMIVAPGIDAIRRGEYEMVMGELHLGVNTLRGSCFVAQHPSQEDLFHAIETDLPTPRVVPVTPKQWPQLTARTQVALVSPRDYRLEITHDSLGAQRSQAIPIGAVVVEETPGGLVARTRDKRLQFDLIEAFGDVLATQVTNCFKMLRPANHLPRVKIDRLIVCRESWTLPVSEVEFAYEKDQAKRFLAARRWARDQGMPRSVFVKAPVEVKPFYVDFSSPIFVDIFAKVVRRTEKNESEESTITITEMLPTPDQVWLPDAEGQLYTSELRFVAVDLKKYRQ